MCAMMPMLRVLAKGDCLGIAVIPETTDLPAVVRERLVGFRHAVRVLALLHRAAAQVGGVEQLVGELFLHRLAVAARGGVADQPADAEREPPVRVDLDRHLIVRAADATRLHLEARLDVVDRLLEDLQRIVRGLLLDDVEALVEDPLRGAALAVAHHAVDELGDQRALVHRIRGDVALGDNSSSWHLYIPDIAECGLRIAESALRLLWSLGAVLGPSLHPALDADRVERPAHDVIADARQILDAAAADQHQRVLLQVMADAGNVGRHLDAVGQPDARHLAQRRVRLLGRLGEDADADAALLRAVLQRRALGLGDDLLAAGAYELADSRHFSSRNADCGWRIGADWGSIRSLAQSANQSAIGNPRSAMSRSQLLQA